MQQRQGTTIARHAEKRYGCDKASDGPHFDKNAYHNAGRHHAESPSNDDGMDYFDNQNREQYAVGHGTPGVKKQHRAPVAWRR